SSRRRHTRSKRDWSSDVCSSDLVDDPLTNQVGGQTVELAAALQSVFFHVGVASYSKQQGDVWQLLHQDTHTSTQHVLQTLDRATVDRPLLEGDREKGVQGQGEGLSQQLGLAGD